MNLFSEQKLCISCNYIYNNFIVIFPHIDFPTPEWHYEDYSERLNDPLFNR